MRRAKIQWSILYSRYESMLFCKKPSIAINREGLLNNGERKQKVGGEGKISRKCKKYENKLTAEIKTFISFTH